MFGTIVLVIATLFFLYTAWSSGIAPVEFAERLGLAVANAGGYNEIRAQYAGFFFAAALACVASLAGVVPRQAAFIVLAVTFGGLLAGRLVSLALDGGIAGYSHTIVALYAIDASGLALAITALGLQHRP
jgi:Domain of unknown function (DUF4345)